MRSEFLSYFILLLIIILICFCFVWLDMVSRSVSLGFTLRRTAKSARVSPHLVPLLPFIYLFVWIFLFLFCLVLFVF